MGKQKKDQLSIVDIATLSKVSPATVSRILNNSAPVSEETKNKVMEVIRQQKYRPNIMASSMRNFKSKLIAVVVPDISDEFFSGIVYAIQKAIPNNSYTCIIFNTAENDTREEKCIEEIKRMNIGGIIAMNSNVDFSMAIPNMPVVYLNNVTFDLTLGQNSAYISGNYYKVGYLAGETFAKHNLMNVAYFISKRFNGVNQLKSDGFYDACRKYNINVVGTKSFSRTTLQQNIREYLDSSKERIDGIFCANDWLTVGATIALRDSGYKVPDDISLIGFGDYKMMEVIQASAIYQPLKEIGRDAIDILIKLINGKKVSNRNILLDIELIDRGTIRHYR